MKRDIDLTRRDERESCFKGIKQSGVKNVGKEDSGLQQ